MSQPSAATVQPRDPDSDLASVASLPSSESSSDTESIDDENDADREWHESLKQLELMLTMVLVPYIGKYFGRKAAYWCEYPCLSLGRPATLHSDRAINVQLQHSQSL